MAKRVNLSMKAAIDSCETKFGGPKPDRRAEYGCPTCGSPPKNPADFVLYCSNPKCPDTKPDPVWEHTVTKDEDATLDPACPGCQGEAEIHSCSPQSIRRAELREKYESKKYTYKAGHSPAWAMAVDDINELLEMLKARNSKAELFDYLKSDYSDQVQLTWKRNAEIKDLKAALAAKDKEIAEIVTEGFACKLREEIDHLRAALAAKDVFRADFDRERLATLELKNKTIKDLKAELAAKTKTNDQAQTMLRQYANKLETAETELAAVRADDGQ